MNKIKANTVNLKGWAKHYYNNVISAIAEDKEPSMCHSFSAMKDGAKDIVLQSLNFSNLYIMGVRKGMVVEDAAKELTERSSALVHRKISNIDKVCSELFLSEFIKRQRKRYLLK